MSRSLKIEKLEVVIIEPEGVGLNIEAELTENDNGDFAVIEATFEIRIGVQKVYGGRADPTTGRFAAKGIPVSKFGTKFELVIECTDETGSVEVRQTLNTENVAAQIDNRRRQMETEADKAVALMGPEEAERERQLKEALKQALEHASGDAENSNGSAFEFLVKYQHHPLVKREIINVAKANPSRFIKNAKYFYEAIWAEEVLTELAKVDPQKMLEKVREFYKYSWAKNIVLEAAKTNPGIAFNEIENYEYMSWAEEVATETAKLDPAAAIYHYNKYRDQPWAAKLLKFSKQRQETQRRIDFYCTLFSQPHNEQDEIDAFNFFVEYDQDDRLGNALSILAEYFPEVFTKYRYLYKNAAWAEKIDKVLSDKCEAEAKAKIEQTINSSCALFSREHTEQNEIDAFTFFVAYQYDERMESALSTLAGYFPEVFIKHKSLYVEAVWAKKVLAIAQQNVAKNEAERRERIGGELNGIIKELSRIPMKFYPLTKYKFSVEELPRQAYDRHSTFISNSFTFFVKHQHDESVVAAVSSLVQSHPEIFARNFFSYQGAAWAEKINKILFERLPMAKHIPTIKEWQIKAEDDPIATLREILLQHQSESWVDIFLSWMSKKYPNGVVTKKFIRNLGVPVRQTAEKLIKPSPFRRFLKMLDD